MHFGLKTEPKKEGKIILLNRSVQQVFQSRQYLGHMIRPKYHVPSFTLRKNDYIFEYFLFSSSKEE